MSQSDRRQAAAHHDGHGHSAHGHGSSSHHAAGAHGHDPHDSAHHAEPAEETLAPDEQPTPLWLPVLGAGLFLVAFILIAAF